MFSIRSKAELQFAATQHPSFRAAVAASFGVELVNGTSRRMMRFLLTAAS